LAAITAVGIGVLILAGRFLPGTFSRYSVKAWFFGAVLILTLSTGGIVLGVLLVVTAFGFRLLLSRYNWNLFRPTVLLPSVLIAAVAVRAHATVVLLVQNRVIQRITGENTRTGGGVEDFDQTVLAFLADNPWWIVTGSGWGNIHNLSQAYIPPQFAYYMQDTIFVAKSGYLKIVSENGLIGVLLLLFFEAVTLSQLYQRFDRGRIYKFFFTMVVISWIAFMVRSHYVIYEYIILHGLALSLIYNNTLPAEEESTRAQDYEKSSP
jgi:O-antigen ligase